MRSNNSLHDLESFRPQNQGKVVPLITPWVIGNALKAYQITISDFAEFAGVDAIVVVELVTGRRGVNGAIRAAYRKLRDYEALMIERFELSASVRRQAKLQWPRFVTDSHLAQFSSDDWQQFGSVRIVSGVQQFAAQRFTQRSGVPVEFITFNKITYELWLEQFELSHSPQGMLEWAHRSAG